jgi:hypothetical protein
MAAISMVSFAAYLVLCLFTLIYGIDLVSPELGIRSFTLYIALIGVSPLVTISAEVLQGWYYFLIAAIIISAIWMLVRSGPNFVRELTLKGRSRDHSPFFEMCGLMFAIFFINTVIVLVMTGMGSEPGAPTEDIDTWELLFLLANASVWEEIIFRVLFIGVPLVAVSAILTRDHWKSLKILRGGGVSIGMAEVTLVLVSACIFGFAHFEGWGAWKIFPSSLAGVAFGYVFLKHGLAAAIMLHFSFDYLSMPLLVFEDSLALQLTVGLGILLWLGVGSVFVIYYTVRVFEFLTGKRYFDPRTVEEPRYARPVQWRPPVDMSGIRVEYAHTARESTEGGAGSPGANAPGFGGYFICRACGSTTARWLDGGLQCLRCGRVFK